MTYRHWMEAPPVRFPHIGAEANRAERMLAQMLRWSWPDEVSWSRIAQREGWPENVVGRAVIRVGETRYEVQVTLLP